LQQLSSITRAPMARPNNPIREPMAEEYVMNYRSLLVYLDDSERCAARIDIAIRLARQFEGHLAGLAPTGRMPLPITGGLGATAPLALEPVWEDLRQRAEIRTQAFRERCASAGLRSFEAVVDDDETAPSIVHHGHCSDLVVIGQAQAGSPDVALARAMVEQVVLHSARPTLVVPYAGSFERIGDNALVAWNDSREAARAVADALPLLCRARQVRVLKCETPLDSEDPDTAARLEALQRWLMWHGVDAEVHREVTEIDVGNALLSRAADVGADLIVMGAYGHTRWSERVLGGATRTLLATMTLPVLMSH
jgi:nucleotide-binding universal stress UspA family protein